jgi:hypothetical protein
MGNDNSGPNENTSGEIRDNEQTGTGTGTGNGTGTGTGKRTKPRKSNVKETTAIIEEIEPENITVDPPEIAPVKSKRPNPRTIQKNQKVAAENALILLSLIDGLAQSVFGPSAALNPFEHTLIDEPLERILSRMDWQTGEQVGRWMDPVLLTLGMIAWVSRLYQLARNDNDNNNRKPPPEPERPNPSPSGEKKVIDNGNGYGTIEEMAEFTTLPGVPMRGSSVTVDAGKVGKIK